MTLPYYYFNRESSIPGAIKIGAGLGPMLANHHSSLIAVIYSHDPQLSSVRLPLSPPFPSGTLSS
jgi:hypothetical protein